MTTATTLLTIDSDPVKVADLYYCLLALCRDAELSGAAAFKLTLVVIEAVNNSIAHGYGGESGHPITVRWRCEDGAVDVEIRDRGEPHPADLRDQSVMGLSQSPLEAGHSGSIIRGWADSAHYSRIGDENVLSLDFGVGAGADSQMTTTSTTSLTLDSDPTKVPDLYYRLLGLCRDAGLDGTAAFQLIYAIVEVVSNIIEHGYLGEPGHPITIHWRSLADAVDVEIRDCGRQVPADIIEKAVMPAPDAEHGRGCYGIREWTDSARYARIGDENVLNLTRRR